MSAVPLTGVERPIRFEIVVHGVARTQGSKSAAVVGKVLTNRPGHRVVLNPRAVVLEGKSGPQRTAFEGWRHAIATEARRWARLHPAHQPFDVPVSIAIVFALPRPQNERRARYHSRKPDLDKLTRAVFDALRGIVYLDDSRISALHALKTYANGTPFASIRIEPLELEPLSQGAS
jgi:Holliday junction resolvase RusA-like endonuclease